MPKFETWNRNVQLDSSMMLCAIERIDSAGTPWVRLSDGRVEAAKSTTAVSNVELLAALESGSQVLVALLADTEEPVIVGILATRQEPVTDSKVNETVQAEIDGDRIVLTGENEVVIRCGKASITLTKAGKILMRGEYLSSRSTGVNRVKGGSVQIN